jgi:hypothetical protein
MSAWRSFKAPSEMKTHSKSLLSLAFASAIPGSMLVARGATPLYQWNFNGADGSNTGAGTGGNLTTNVGAGTSSGSFSGSGVTGNAGDQAFSSYNSWDDYWAGPIGDAATGSTLDLSGLNQFTITMWINRDAGRTPDVLNIGGTTTPGAASNPGISVGLDGSWANGVRFGVNGYNAWTGDLWSAGYNSGWVFLALVYDGAGGVWWNPDMNTLYGANSNGAVITGDMSTAATVAANLNMHIGDWSTAPGTPALGATATAFLANDGSSTNGFAGSLDDIRIYNSLLPVSEIEAIRLEALAVPEPSAAVLGAMGVMALLRRRRN